jgi:hypothetical protein
MKINKKLLLLVFLVIGIASMNCTGMNPIIDLDDPSTFPGSYKIVSYTDLSGEDFGQPGFTILSNKPTTITFQLGETSITMTVSLTGTLTLTETRYTISQTMTMSISGLAEEIQTETDAGTYIIEGSTITIASDDPSEDPEVGTISVNRGEMTIEFAATRVVLQKQ